MLKSSITGLSIFNNFCANVVVDGSTINLGLQDIVSNRINYIELSNIFSFLFVFGSLNCYMVNMSGGL
jgi:hypothetical protein